MNRNDGFGAMGDQSFETGFIDVQSVGSYVGKYNTRAPQGESVGGRNKGEGWNDYLVAGTAFEEKRRQFQGVSTRSGQQDFGNIQLMFQQRVALVRERAIAGGMPVSNGLPYVLILVARKARPVEWDGVIHIFRKTNSFWVP